MKVNADSSPGNIVNHKELIALIYKSYNSHILKMNGVIFDTFKTKNIYIAISIKNRLFLNQI